MSVGCCCCDAADRTVQKRRCDAMRCDAREGQERKTNLEGLFAHDDLLDEGREEVFEVLVARKTGDGGQEAGVDARTSKEELKLAFLLSASAIMINDKRGREGKGRERKGRERRGDALVLAISD